MPNFYEVDMSASKGRTTDKPKTEKKSVPNAKTLDVLDDFNQWVDSCRKAVNAKMDELKSSGRTNSTAQITACNNELINKFRGAKWSP